MDYSFEIKVPFPSYFMEFYHIYFYSIGLLVFNSLVKESYTQALH